MDESRIDGLLKEMGMEKISPADELVDSTIKRMKRVDGIDVVVVAAVILNLLSFTAAAFFIIFAPYGLFVKVIVFVFRSTVMNLSILLAYIFKAQLFPAANEI